MKLTATHFKSSKKKEEKKMMFTNFDLQSKHQIFFILRDQSRLEKGFRKEKDWEKGVQNLPQI